MSFKNLRNKLVMMNLLLILISLIGCNNENSNSKTTTLNTSVINDVKVKTAAAEDIKVTLIELGSEKCIPCKMMQPVMEKIRRRYPGQVEVVFHDVLTDAGKKEGYKFAIRVIPTQVFLDNTGKEYFRHEGFFPFEEVDRILKQKNVN